MKLVMSVGTVLLLNDVLLLIYWLLFGIVVIIHDVDSTDRYLPIHVTVAFHFPATVGLCLALEAFKALRTIRYGVITNSGYLLSWTITFFVSLGTDISSVAYLAILWKTSDVAWIGEFAMFVWATASTLMVIFWSVWLWIVVDGREKK